MQCIVLKQHLKEFNFACWNVLRHCLLSITLPRSSESNMVTSFTGLNETLSFTRLVGNLKVEMESVHAKQRFLYSTPIPSPTSSMKSSLMFLYQSTHWYNDCLIRKLLLTATNSTTFSCLLCQCISSASQTNRSR